MLLLKILIPVALSTSDIMAFLSLCLNAEYLLHIELTSISIFIPSIYLVDNTYKF